MLWFIAGIAVWILLLLVCWIWLDGPLARPLLRSPHGGQNSRSHKRYQHAPPNQYNPSLCEREPGS